MGHCFVIMSLKDEYLRVYKDGIKPAVEASDFECVRADDNRLPKNIHSHVIRSLIDASLVIADLTEPSPNVYYEVGISHTLGKKTIILTQALSTLPFDLGAEYSTQYTPTPEGIELLGHRLRETIDLIKRNPASSSNLVQLVGKDHFDLQGQIRSTLTSLTEDRKRLAAFDAFVTRGRRSDNSPLIQTLAKRIISSAPSAGRHAILVGVSGAAAIGKTTLSADIARYLDAHGHGPVLHLPLDSFMHDRAIRRSQNLSGYDPRANDLGEAARCLRTLAAGDSITYHPYDHGTGKHLDTSIASKPARVVIADGIHALNARLQPHLDLRVFIDASAPVAKELRFMADVSERGYIVTEAFRHADEEYAKYLLYIFPYMRVADVVMTCTGYWEYEAEIA